MSSNAPIPGFIAVLSAAAVVERGLPLTMGPQFRAMERAGYDEESHTVSMALSSDKPVERSYGTEILSHKPGAIRTERLKQGIPLLFNHDMDQHLGVSVGFEISGGTLRTTSRFGSNPLAQEKELDVRTGILKDNSVGYMVYEWEIVEDTKGNRTFTATDWEPFEGSLVTVPADAKGSGVGRNSGEGEVPVKYTLRKLEDDSSEGDGGEDADDDEEDDEAENERSAEVAPSPTPPSSAPPQPTTEKRNTMEVEVKDVAAENQVRVEGLRALNKQFPEHFNERSLKLAEDLGVSVETAKSRVADAAISAAQRNDVPTIADEVFGGMTERDLTRYSISGAYRAAANIRTPGTFTGKENEGGYEREVGHELRKVAEKRGVRDLGAGVAIPSSTTLSLARAQRTIASGGNAGTATNFTTVSTDPVELLRNRCVLLAMGAQMLSGLHGAVQMTKQTGAASSNWVTEGTAAMLSDPTLGFFTMKPNRLTMGSSYFRDFLAQSGLSVDSFLANDRNAVLARSLDTAGLAGSGTTPVPKGLLNLTGLALVLAGTTRAANGTVQAGAGGLPMTFVDYNNLEAVIATANADIGTMGIITTPRVRAAGRSTPKTPGTATDYIWPTSPVAANGTQEGPLGYKAITTSNSVLTGFTANGVSNLHAVIMGVFDQFLFGDWGLSELIVDPYTGAANAQMNFWEHAYYDVNVRHVEAFAACTSALPS